MTDPIVALKDTKTLADAVNQSMKPHSSTRDFVADAVKELGRSMKKIRPAGVRKTWTCCWPYNAYLYKKAAEGILSGHFCSQSLHTEEMGEALLTYVEQFKAITGFEPISIGTGTPARKTRCEQI